MHFDTRSVSEAVAALGGIDILVNSAATGHTGTIVDIDVNDTRHLQGRVLDDRGSDFDNAIAQRRDARSIEVTDAQS